MARQALTPGLKSGPCDVRAVFDWPTDMWTRVMDADVDGSRFRRVVNFFDRGIMGTSEFSRWDSQSEATRLGREALEWILGWKTRSFLWLRSSDIDAGPRSVVVAQSDLDDSAACVLGDIKDHVSDEVQALLKQAEPCEASDKTEKSSAYGEFDGILRGNLIVAFCLGKTSWC